MKKVRTYWCSFLLLLFISSQSLYAQQPSFLLQFKTVTELQSFLSYSTSRIPLVSAHRGGPEKGYPENAIETFAHSILFQPVIIECDIALSKDSVLVMMHDDRLDRTSTGTGFIRDYNYSQLTLLQLKDNEGNLTAFHIPKLDEVLSWGKGKVIFTLDVKRGVPYSKVLEAVKRAKAENCSVIITYNVAQAAEVTKLSPELMISVSIKNKDDLERLHESGVPDNRMVAFIGVSEADSALYNLLHEHKIQSIMGVMGNIDRQAVAKGDKVYYDIIVHGADILSGDRPKETGLILQQYRKDQHLQNPHISKQIIKE